MRERRERTQLIHGTLRLIAGRLGCMLCQAGLFACGALAGCNRAESPLESSPPPPVPVQVAQSERTDIPVQIQAVGWVEATASVTVRPQVDGRLSAVRFQEGQFVKAGDVLFEIDARPFEAEVRLSEANLARDRALAEDAAREAARLQTLFNRGESASRESEAAEAVAAAKAAQVRADEAEVATAKLRLEYCTIRAPLTGRTGRFEVTPGNIVKENETALVTLEPIDPINIVFSVPERYGERIRKSLDGQPVAVEARPPEDTDQVVSGKVTFVDSQVDASTGMIRLKATFTNATHALWPGQYMQVQLTLDTLRDVVVVPTVAVQVGQSGSFLFVVRPDNTVEMRSIETGLVQDARSVVTTGLEAGETVVTDGHLRLKPGASVEKKTELPAGAVREGT